MKNRAAWNEVLKRLVGRSVGQAGTEVGIGYCIGEGPGRRVVDGRHCLQDR